MSEVPDRGRPETTVIKAEVQPQENSGKKHATGLPVDLHHKRSPALTLAPGLQ